MDGELIGLHCIFASLPHLERRREFSSPSSPSSPASLANALDCQKNGVSYHLSVIIFNEWLNYLLIFHVVALRSTLMEVPNVDPRRFLPFPFFPSSLAACVSLIDEMMTN